MSYPVPVTGLVALAVADFLYIKFKLYVFMQPVH